MAANALNNLAKAAVGVGAGVSLIQSSIYNVDGGYRAVMFDRLRGVQRAVSGEGTHFRIPWLQTPHLFDVRIRPRNISSNTGTKDLQVVTINLRVLSRPEEEHLPDIFSSLGLDYDERVLPSIGNEVLKAVVAQYNAESLITKREMVSQEVRDALTKRAAEFHVRRRHRQNSCSRRASSHALRPCSCCQPWPAVPPTLTPSVCPNPRRQIKLDDVAITDLKFGKEFTAAIESKQVAEQDAERARFLVEKSEQEKRANIIRAEGECAQPTSPSTRGGTAGAARHALTWRTITPTSHAAPATTFSQVDGSQGRVRCASGLARSHRAAPHRGGQGHCGDTVQVAQRHLLAAGRPEHAAQLERRRWCVGIREWAWLPSPLATRLPTHLGWQMMPHGSSHAPTDRSNAERRSGGGAVNLGAIGAKAYAPRKPRCAPGRGQAKADGSRDAPSFISDQARWPLGPVC